MPADVSLHDAAAEARIDEACAEIGLSPALWSAILDLRTANAGAFNRRRLFAALDSLFDSPAPPSSPAFSILAPRQDTPAGGQVTLRRLTFKNWKVFQSARFDFPDHDPDKPVVLIGGKNGYGKTSFLKGLLYGLFGRTAVLDLDDRSAGSQGQPQRASAYREAMERALHRPARDRGDGVMSVRSEWRTDEGEIVIERRWYFDEAGALVDEDEALNIWIGEELEVLPVPDGEDTTRYYQAQIADRLMPPSLAAFVLFDGEQVKKFAQRDFAEQVRIAVETVLGLSAWRDAIADLRDYARDRARGGPRQDDRNQTDNERLEALRRSVAAAIESLRELEMQTAPLKMRRDEILETLGGLAQRTFSTMQDMLERRHALAGDAQRVRHEMATTAATELPFLLVGARLRETLSARLAHERDAIRTRAIWADGAALEQLVGALSSEMGDRLSDLEPGLRRVWLGLSEQDRSSVAVIHAYLSLDTREAVLSRLEGVEARGTVPVTETSGHLDSLVQAQAALEAEILERESQDQIATGLKLELDTITRDIADLEVKRRQLDQQLGRVQSELQESEAAIESRVLAQMSDAQLIARRRAALDVADKGEALIKDLKPGYFDAVGRAVTKAYRALAHKGLVDQIVITPDGRVVLLDGRGVDIGAIEASAGESQIFAMALVAAVAGLSGRRLPSIIDTPLGRLDSDHRQRVLAFFTSRDVQTVLLSQPDEVNAQYLSLIRDRVAAQFHLDHQLRAGGPGGSILVDGYFPEIAA
jgi:DNA sulfur modification protein DndD